MTIGLRQNTCQDSLFSLIYKFYQCTGAHIGAFFLVQYQVEEHAFKSFPVEKENKYIVC